MILSDYLCRTGMHRCALDAQRVRVGVILLDEAVAQLFDGDALFIGTADQLIIDIGEILDNLTS